MKITTGDLEIFESGLVKNGFTNSIKLDLQGIWVEFIFMTDGANIRSAYFPSDDLEGLKIHAYNYNKPSGGGTYKPIKIGTFQGLELWLSYYITKAFDEYDTWTLEYVFYKGAAVNE